MFEEAFKGALAGMMHALGDVMTYKPHNGASVEIKAVPIEIEPTADFLQGGVNRPTRVYELPVDMAPNLSKADQFVIGATTYGVAEKELFASRTVWRVQLRRVG